MPRLSAPDRFWPKVSVGQEHECWLWQGSYRKSGHGIFKYEGRLQSSHAVALILSGAEKPAGTLALHSCDTPRCCNPKHLRWGTPLDNIRDMYERGRANTTEGERNVNAVLSKSEALAIYALKVESPEYGRKARIARQFRISPKTIADIWNGYTWSSSTGAAKTRPSRLVKT